MAFIKCTACDTDNVSNSRYSKNCGKELPKAVEETKIENLLPKEKKSNKKVLQPHQILFHFLLFRKVLIHSMSCEV